MHRLREWDAVATLVAPELTGDDLELVVLEPTDHPFSRALAGSLRPPYRARGVRQEGARWSVAARRLRVADLPGVAGEELELTVHDGRRSLVVDGMPTVSGLDVVLAAAEPEHESYVVRARRLRDAVWELDVVPL